MLCPRKVLPRPNFPEPSGIRALLCPGAGALHSLWPSQLLVNRILTIIAALICSFVLLQKTAAQTSPSSVGTAGRERLLMDFGWRFAFGHATDPAKDFDAADAYFNYLAKTGAGAGAAAADFDDRAWRKLNLPHDWGVEVPFDNRGSASHGYKAVGKNFPTTSVGWYRKTFAIPASDLGRHITVEFDGVYRDSQVWVNGFYLGREPSGYSGFSYDLTDYLNYGGENVIAVRVDATLEEGWFYEGAGIYRHVWLTKTSPLHVAKWGTCVTTEVKENSADVTARVTVNNDAPKAATFAVEQTILDADGAEVARQELPGLSLKAGATGEFSAALTVPSPRLWSVETPYLYKLVTTITAGGAVVDRYETPFGIRTLRWDANEGFFLNGRRVELKGTCDHQDAAGVGVAVPDELNVYRVEQLKKMGSNAIRTSHNAPTPELLDACDRLGMLVMDENRETGANPQELGELERLIVRDRNHPCVIIWSLGNEEWIVESNEKGGRITQTMQTLAQLLDPTRRYTMAISGGWGQGTSIILDVMGFNYFTHGDNDQYHKKFPDKPSVATEDASTFSTRGIYVQDRDHQHLTAYDTNKPDWGITAEESWSHYAARPYVAGLFQWTGFDYRGEETPFGWPAISSQFGILDTCGFPKDNFYYYQAWWSDQPVLHLFPHWNWPGQEGQDIDVWVHSNCEEVELFLNGQSQGRQKMSKNSHLEWKVKYAPGTLLARGYNGGKEVLTDQVETTGAPAGLQLTPNRPAINADGEDVSVITVQVNDAQQRRVPAAANEVAFSIAGPGKIIGVGNGDPSSHEPDQFVETVRSLPITNWHQKPVDGTNNEPETAADFDDSGWRSAFGARDDENRNGDSQPVVYRGSFDLPQDSSGATMALLLRGLGERQSVFLNGKPLAENVSSADAAREIAIPAEALRPGKNVIAILATPAANRDRKHDDERKKAGSPARIRVTVPAGEWKRSLFSGLAQVIVQSTGQPGEITLTAKSPGVAGGVLKLRAQPAPPRPSVGAHLDGAPGTGRASEVGQASSLSDERASASMKPFGFPGAVGGELNARAARSPDRLEACPTLKAFADWQSGAVSSAASVAGN
jgi:beta-galactosidase